MPLKKIYLYFEQLFFKIGPNKKVVKERIINEIIAGIKSVEISCIAKMQIRLTMTGIKPNIP